MEYLVLEKEPKKQENKAKAEWERFETLDIERIYYLEILAGYRIKMARKAWKLSCLKLVNHPRFKQILKEESKKKTKVKKDIQQKMA